jgi:hypothetical protein
MITDVLLNFDTQPDGKESLLLSQFEGMRLITLCGTETLQIFTKSGRIIHVETDAHELRNGIIEALKKRHGGSTEDAVTLSPPGGPADNPFEPPRDTWGSSQLP